MLKFNKLVKTQTYLLRKKAYPSKPTNRPLQLYSLFIKPAECFLHQIPLGAFVVRFLGSP